MQAKVTDQRTGSVKDPLAELAELSDEHARLLEQKARTVASGKTPSTTTNFELTKIVKRMTDTARAQREGGDDRGEQVRAQLREDADEGSLAAGDTLDLLVDEDPWWGEG